MSAVDTSPTDHRPPRDGGSLRPNGAAGVTPATLSALRERLRAAGARPVHEAAVMREWLQLRPHDGGKRKPEDFLPRALREAWSAIDAEWRAVARLQSAHPAEDGAERLLIELADGQLAEAVLLPRDGLCVSTQIGCAVRCSFCMTGRQGLVRQLGSAEIVAQVVLARQRRAVHKVVFMGMGEPAHNLDAVMEAIEALGVQYQWTLLAGINDGDDEIDGIVRLLAGRHGMLNLIPYNRVEGLPYRRPDAARAASMAATLRRRGVITTLRQSAAQDVDAGCGQLRARAVTLRRAVNP